MKHLFLGLILTMLPMQALYANTVVRSGDTVTMAENQSIEGSFYVVGGTVALSGKVVGDATVIGGNVTVGGEISEDLAILAGTVNLQAPVSEDVRIVAGQVTITKNVAGNLIVVAGKLTISSDAKITGDVLFYGGELVVGGEIGGKLLGSADSVRVDTVVNGGIDMSARILTLGEQAKITGGVRYASDNDMVRAPNASVEGEVTKNAPVVRDEGGDSGRFEAILFLVSLFATLSLYLVFRKLVESFAMSVRSGLLIKTIVGFMFVFIAPLFITILIVSVLGSLIGLVALALCALVLTLAFPLMAVTAGSLIAYLIEKKSHLSVPYLLLGAVVVHLVLLVPIIGVVLIVLLYMTTVGSLVDTLYRSLR